MAVPNGASRRAFLMGSVFALPVAAIGMRFLGAAEAARLAAPAIESYQPVFFANDEWRFILAACDRLIPADDVGPGALEANVPVFIDQELNGSYGKADNWYMQGPFDPNAPALMGYQLPYTPQELYRRGIRAVDAYARQTYQKPFTDLDAKTRDDVLTKLQRNQIDFAAFEEPVLKASAFFGFLLTNTQEGYLSDPMYGGNRGMEAWKMIGFPGARASFLEWIGQHNVKYPLGPVSVLGERA
ncbi:MAG: gluconate 2-dehydrogenase [Tardiphaga sp.]|jgi:gluconate 2-dehydrogenase gamma chain|uniref:gluconate 2-dehydrogenase subunit 3 family protein n=1 Tax=Tardiphaga sp. TaxID=1926292 RepID=UPI0026321169|nr:gluconate 2-dehydrogenase subunit 3 family protein [Tardiphaga sp.]MDB5500900.1 gluconate 2-dehydrogenase [Tardiphaga sp.]